MPYLIKLSPFDHYPVINSGSITGVAGPGGGWALAVENDNSDPITITNSGTISHINGLGVGVFIGSGPATIRNTGSLYGGLTGIAAQTYHGNMTIYEHILLGCGANGNGTMVLGKCPASWTAAAAATL